jgi:ankyrin repeat protein
MDEIEVQSRRSRESSVSTTISSISTRRSSDSIPPPSSITPPAISPPFPSKSHARINRRNQAGETALHRACAAGKLDDVKELLDRGADVNAQCNAGWTPLHKACLKGWVEIVRLLCERGANPDIASTDEHDTPLHDACSNGHIPVVTVLLDHGANPRLHNSEGFFPDEMVDDDDLELKRIILNAKKSFKETKRENDEREDSEPPVSPATKRLTRRVSVTSEMSIPGPSNRSRRSGNTRDDLLARDIAYRDKHNRGHLHLTSAQGDADFVNELLKMGANYKARDKDGNTPLHLAARGGHHGAVVRLLEYGGEVVNYQNKAGETPLHEVAGRGHKDTIEALMMYGADPTIRDNRGRTALDVAIELSSTAAEGEIELLKSKFIELDVELPIEKPQTKDSASVKVEEADDALQNMDDTLPEVEEAPRITLNGVDEHSEKEDSNTPQQSPVPTISTRMNDFDVPMAVAEEEGPAITTHHLEDASKLQNLTTETISKPIEVLEEQGGEETAEVSLADIAINDEQMDEVIPETSKKSDAPQQTETTYVETTKIPAPEILDRQSPALSTEPPNQSLSDAMVPPFENPSESIKVSEKPQEPVSSPPVESGPPPLWTTMASLDSISPELQKEISIFTPFYRMEYLDVSGEKSVWVAHSQVCSLLGFTTQEFITKCKFHTWI